MGKTSIVLAMNNTNQTKTRVVVCGTNYGRAYASLFLAELQDFELTCLYAKGSQRSLDLAELLKVPLIDDLNDLPRVDIACVAVPANIQRYVVTSLLSRNINVLVEHPVAAVDLREYVEIARSKGVCIHLNSHFSSLGPAIAFANEARRHLSQSTCRSIQLSTSDRALFSTLDLIGRVFNCVLEIEITECRSKDRFPNKVFFSDINGTPATISVSNADEDNDRATPSLQSVVLEFETAVLTILDLAGPVVVRKKLSSSVGKTSEEGMLRIVRDSTLGSFLEFKKSRALQNLKSLKKLSSESFSGAHSKFQNDEYLLKLCAAHDKFLSVARENS